jgi:hypothetical protein
MAFRYWGCRVLIALLPALSGLQQTAWGLQPFTAEETARYAELDARPLHSFTNTELAEYLSLRRRTGRDASSPGAEIAHFARKAVSQPFKLHAARFDLSRSDCVVFVERSLALGLAADWNDYYRLSQRLRYKNGLVDVLERNFCTLSEWQPSNTAWLLRDVTDELGVETESFEYAVFPRRFLQNVRYGLGFEPVPVDH